MSTVRFTGLVALPGHLARTTRAAALVASIALAGCVGAGNARPAPTVGSTAPDFTVRAITREGPMPAPITLSGLRGKTVVIAFFPKARTPGCTTQLTAYRDRYAALFHGGKDVVLLAVSTDSEGALLDWAREAGFPFALVSDADGSLGKAYGALTPGGLKFAKRLLFVVGPDGRVAYEAKPFRQNAEEAYTELAAAIDRVAAR